MTSTLTPEQPGDPTEHLDNEVIYEGQGANAGLEALTIKGLLEANDITVFASEGEPYHSLPVLLRVPKDQLERAKRVLSEAESAGPAAAEAAELAGERALPERNAE
jgi:hypothetical protein